MDIAASHGAMGTDLERSSMTGAAVKGVNFANVVMMKKTRLLPADSTRIPTRVSTLPPT